MEELLKKIKSATHEHNMTLQTRLETFDSLARIALLVMLEEKTKRALTWDEILACETVAGLEKFLC